MSPTLAAVLLFPGVLAVTRLNRHILPRCIDCELVITSFRVGLFRGEPQVVLITQLLAYGFVNIVDGIFFRHLKEAATGLLCQLLRDLLTISVTARKPPS